MIFSNLNDAMILCPFSAPRQPLEKNYFTGILCLQSLRYFGFFAFTVSFVVLNYFN